ncbi:hypothetical protein J4E93_005084 [Alternaria ventricosa]|uniref:uncharacterized protein n=1 Tax=Alternaria ventricosa TaxID=1187951 RepID=UPI0020C2B153|nr:uncharacterized protein J4E93_005084 [Alternaria ventricosa]KAI4646860.1 hypothetical protein J4E93_005084 [Alternaria ventricosa]
MSDSPVPAPLSPTAAEFFPGQAAHPSPAPSERVSSPATPPQHALNAQFQYQLPQQPQGLPWCSPSFYGYQPYPLYDGYTHYYNQVHNPFDMHATPPMHYVQPQGPMWTQTQTSYIGYTEGTPDAFTDQHREVNSVRAGRMPYQNPHGEHHQTGNGANPNTAYRRRPRKNNRKRYQNRARDQNQDQDEDQNYEQDHEQQQRPGGEASGTYRRSPHRE